jgi:hypothetical protein
MFPSCQPEESRETLSDEAVVIRSREAIEVEFQLRSRWAKINLALEDR